MTILFNFVYEFIIINVHTFTYINILFFINVQCTLMFKIIDLNKIFKIIFFSFIIIKLYNQ